MASKTDELRQKYGVDPNWRNSVGGENSVAVSPTIPPSNYEDPKRAALRETYGVDPNWRTANQPQDDRNYGWGMTSAFLRGFERLRALPDVAQGDYEELAQHMGNMANYELDERDRQRMEELQNTEGWWEATKYYLQNPTLIGQIVAESLPMMAAPIVGAVGGGVGGGAAGTAIGGPGAGTAVGTVGGAMAGGALGSYATEYYASMQEFFGQNGVDITDANALKAAFQNEDLMVAAREHGRKRGIPIAIFDGLSMGLAGRIGKPVSNLVRGATPGTARRVAGGVAGATAEMGMQAGAGMAGEAGAQISAEGEITDIPGVIAEGFGEIVPGAVEAGVTGYLDRRNERLDRVDPKDSPLAALLKESDPIVQFMEDMQKRRERGLPVPETRINPETERLEVRTADGWRPPESVDVNPVTGEAVLRRTNTVGVDAAQEIKDPNTGETIVEQDMLDVQLEDALQDLQMSIEAQAMVEDVAAAGAKAAQAAQGSRNMQMIELEAERAAALGKQQTEAERQKQREIDQMYADQAAGIVAEDTGGAAPGSMLSQGQRALEGEPVDVAGAQPVEEGMILPEGVNPAGGRPFGTPLSDALRGAGIVPPDDEGPTGGGAPTRGPDVSPAEQRAAETLQYETEDLEERAAIQADDTPTDEGFVDDVPYLPEEFAPTPAVEWADKRLANRDYHRSLDRLAGETLEGGGITLVESDEIGVTYDKRTKSQNPPWMQGIIENERIGRKAVLNAVEKAKAGKRLGVKQKRIVQAMLDEIDMPSEYAGQQETTAPAFELEQEQDGVVPEKPVAPAEPRQEVDADIGVPGDMFSEGANKQVDLVDETREAAKKEIPLREISKSDLEALAVETENLIEKYIENGEQNMGFDKTEILSGVQKLKLHKHPRAADIEQIARDAIEGRGTVPPTEELSERDQKFMDLADRQRGKPEKAMLKVQFANGGGILQPVVENVGDLTHRMSESYALQAKMGYEFVKPKVDSSLERLRQGYGFDREFKENLKSNAEFNKVSLKSYTSKVNKALDAYWREHTKLPVYNEMQRAARDAAVAVGEKDWAKAQAELEILEAVLNEGPDAWAAEAGKFDPNFEMRGTDELYDAVYEQIDTDNVVTLEIDEANFERMGRDTEERVFKSTVDAKKRKGIDTKLKGTPYLKPKEADAIVTQWEADAIAQSKEKGGPQNHKDNFNRVIISLFDTTGVWANPYALAGYDVRALDIKDGIDITEFSTQFMDEMFNNFEGKEVYGILAACPCTTFANSSTRWRKDRHENADPVESRKWIEKMWGKEAAEARDPDTGEYTYATPHDYAIALVHKTMQTLEYLRPKFWALENPEGRIETAAGLPGPWRTGFQPNNFGEPYTKRTLLWGEFNEDLPTANVEPTEGSKMHMMSPSADRQAARSETPVGFSYAFFKANNYLDTSPLERTKADYWYVEGAIEEAFKAGVTEEQIRDNVYLDLAYEPDESVIEEAKQSIRDLIEGGPTTPGTPTTPTTPPPPPIPTEAELTEIAAETATPTKKQAKAGNYKKARMNMAGFGIAIENAVDSVRYGNMKMRDIYGYFEEFKGADKDKLDVFVNPKAAEDFEGDVYVIDQYIDGKFDEHKVMLGYNNMLDAKRAYKRNYQKGWKGLQSAAKMTADEFRDWASNLKQGTNKQAATFTPADTKSPAFKKWFGDSKVVDKKGEPLIAYHGTQNTEEYYTLDPLKGDSFGGWNGFGTWFTDKFEHAHLYANRDPFIGAEGRTPEIGRIIPAYISIQNPLNIDFDGFQMLVDNLMKKTGVDKFSKEAGPTIKAHLQKLGYDGVIMRDFTGDSVGGKMPPQDMFIALESEQVKSAANNRGTFDKANKDIRYASGRGLAGAPNKAWMKKVLEGGDRKMGDLPDTMPLNVAVSELLNMRNQIAQPEAPVAPARPTLDEVKTAIAPVESAMPGAPVEVLASYKQAPRAVQETMQSEGMTQVRAVFDPQSNKIYLFADQARDANDAVMTALHEKTHLGLRKAFGEKLDPLLDDIFKNVSKTRQETMQKIADRYKLDVGKLADQRVIAEELLAHMAESNVNDGVVNRAVAFIRKLLRDMGFVQQFSDNDIRALIREAQGSVSRAGDRIAGVTVEEEVMLDDTGEVYIVEQDAEQLLTGVDERIEICGKLRKCL